MVLSGVEAVGSPLLEWLFNSVFFGDVQIDEKSRSCAQTFPPRKHDHKGRVTEPV
jgi:hypothetical protein